MTIQTRNPAMERLRTRRGNADSSRSTHSLQRRGEQGYALVALLALMTIMALLLMSAAPSIRHQTQRSLEEEAIWRGEQVAQAIGLYVRLHPTHQLPTSIEELLEGVPRGSKRVQILRPVAARDPLSTSGEWKLIKQNDPAFLDFHRAVIAYAGSPVVKTSDQGFVSAAAAAFGQLPVITNILDTGLQDCTPGDEDDSASSTGPFIGVASRSHRKSIIAYYGIECQDKWIFTPYFR
jgi:type II secretory pathway pseudopilin PulG